MTYMLQAAGKQTSADSKQTHHMLLQQRFATASPTSPASPPNRAVFCVMRDLVMATGPPGMMHSPPPLPVLFH
jgi:hypothetical protein